MSGPVASRPVSWSAVKEQVYMVFPNDLNSNDTVFGGLILAHLDRFVAVAADRHAWGSSMEVGCKVEAELIGGGARRHIPSAYPTFVAMDEQRRPRKIPALMPETPAEQQRFAEAQLRRELRLRHADDLKQFRASRGLTRP